MLETNFVNMKKLDATYRPRQRGVILADEKRIIRETLQIDEMDFLALRNLNDFVKMYYTLKRDNTESIEEKLAFRDKESAIVFVIELHMARYHVA